MKLVLATVAACIHATDLAGYVAVNDVSSIASVDEDVAAVEAALHRGDYTAAETLYSTGSGVFSYDGATSLKALWTPQTQLVSAPFHLFSGYYGAVDYANEFVSAAISGSGDFAGQLQASRKELAVKGIVYQGILMRILAELEKTTVQCAQGIDAAAMLQTWEAAWALFAGAREGTDGSGPGKMMWALGDKRCPQFKTCLGDDPLVGVARVNVEIREAFTAGRGAIQATPTANCMLLSATRERIMQQSVVPVIQGMLREAYESNPWAGAANADGQVEIAEGWAFMSAVLPFFQKCSVDIGQVILDNMQLERSVADPPPLRFIALKASIENAYACLSITCQDVGGMLNSDGTYLPDFEPCQDAIKGNRSHTVGASKPSQERASLMNWLASLLLASFLLTLLAFIGTVVFLRRSQAAKLKEHTDGPPPNMYGTDV